MYKYVKSIKKRDIAQMNGSCYAYDYKFLNSISFLTFGK